MRIVWAFPCDKIIEHADGDLDAHGFGCDALVASSLPGSVSFTLALRIAANGDEFEHPPVFVLEVLGPDGELVHSAGGPLVVGLASPLAEEGEELTSDSYGVIEFEAKRLGNHRVVVSVDGKSGAEFAMRIVPDEGLKRNSSSDV
jgi:hypothetical protein